MPTKKQVTLEAMYSMVESIQATVERIESSLNLHTDDEAYKPKKTLGIVKVYWEDAPWVKVLSEKKGLSEIYDEEELTEWLCMNPNERTGGRPWCAQAILKALEESGIDTTGLDASVVSFGRWDGGYEIEYGALDDIPNGAILVFQPKDGSRIKVSHVGIKVNHNKLLGGNQGDEIKESNLAWYLDNADLVLVLCPNGYELLNEQVES